MDQVLIEAPTNSDVLVTLRHQGSAGLRGKLLCCDSVIIYLRQVL